MKIQKIILISLILLIFAAAIYIGNGYLQNRILFSAIENNDYMAAQNAVQSGAFINTYRYLLRIPELVPTNPTPLVSACKKGNSDIVSLLLDNGADINKKDCHSGETPLIAALHGSKQNRFELAFYLISNGADIYDVQANNSPLKETLLVLDTDSEKTIQEGFALFQYLFEKKADATIRKSKENLLTFAAHYENHNVVRYLIENNYYSIDSVDESGSTALIVAAKYNRVRMVEDLLLLGANSNLQDYAGKSAYDYALEKGHNDIVEILVAVSAG